MSKGKGSVGLTEADNKIYQNLRVLVGRSPSGSKRRMSSLLIAALVYVYAKIKSGEIAIQEIKDGYKFVDRKLELEKPSH